MSQTDECDFMKKTQVNKLVQQQTSKIKGKVNELGEVESIGLESYTLIHSVLA